MRANKVPRKGQKQLWAEFNGLTNLVEYWEVQVRMGKDAEAPKKLESAKRELSRIGALLK